MPRAATLSKGPVRAGMIENSGFKRKTAALTTSRTLKASDSGTLFFVDAADLVIGLPATAKGLEFTFVLRAAGLSAGTGLSISPKAADNIYGNGLTAVDDKDLILAGASDRAGDMVTVVGDGAAGYTITRVIGTWSKQA